MVFPSMMQRIETLSMKFFVLFVWIRTDFSKKNSMLMKNTIRDFDDEFDTDEESW